MESMQKEGKKNMTLCEAIEHARAKGEELSRCGCEGCAQDHLQLAEWLEEYRRLDSLTEHSASMLVGNYEFAYSEWHEPGEEDEYRVIIYDYKTMKEVARCLLDKPLGLYELCDWSAAWLKERKNERD